MKITILHLIRGGFVKRELPNDESVWLLKRDGKVIYKTDTIHRNWRGEVAIIDKDGSRYSEIEDFARVENVKY
jgi:hypothetical protein